MSDEPKFNIDEHAIKILLKRKLFIDGILKLRRKWGLPEDGFTNSQMNVWAEQLRESGRRNEFDKEISVLMDELGLSFRWRRAIYLYLLDNNPYSLRVQSPYELMDEGNPDTPDTILSVSIRIDADTTQRELIQAYKIAEKSFADKKKKQLIINIDRDLKIMEMHQIGMSNPQIVEWLTYNDKGAFTFNSDSIAKIIARTKKKLS